MPTYDFKCERCGTFEAMRPIGRRDEPVACPACGEASARLLTLPTYAAPSSGTRRSEGSDADASAGGSYKRMRHAAACACCR